MIFAHSPVFRRTALWAALSVFWLGGAQALTLNRPVVQSQQGEPLKLEVDITDLKPAEQVDLRVPGLASPEIYRATKIEPPTQEGQPLDLQVKLLKHKNGRPYLQISSVQPIQSSSLDLLVDFRWATGRAMREINLSLDNANAPKSAPSQALGVGMSHAGTASPSHIRVQAGDTASALVARQLPNGVSLDQMLLALLQNNPDAFVDDNVNRLKAGALLTLPTAQQAAQVSREDAFREILVQTQNFQAYRAELAARAPSGTLPKAERSSSGKLQAQVQNKSASNSPDKLTLTRPKDGVPEAKFVEQRQAQEVAERAAELSRNVSELGKIAAATVAATAASGALAAEVPASADLPTNNSFDPLMQWLPVGGLIAALVGLTLWLLRRPRTPDEATPQGLPPLDVNFDLDLPPPAHAAPWARPEASHPPAPSPATPTTPMRGAPEGIRPVMSMPDISLDLDTPPSEPFQVRLALADELWRLGQLHTSRALVEDIVTQATGEMQEQARRWLAERG